jgi:hypothetical protein
MTSAATSALKPLTRSPKSCHKRWGGASPCRRASGRRRSHQDSGRVIIFQMGPDLLGILEELANREPIFHRPELGTSRSDFERMTADDFWEVGASGRRYDRAYVLDELEKRHAAPRTDVWETTGFRCRRLAQDVYLLTYMLLQDNTRRTRRSTIWQRTPEGWKIIFHQGTTVQDS